MSFFPNFQAKLALGAFRILCVRDAKLSFRAKLKKGVYPFGLGTSAS